MSTWKISGCRSYGWNTTGKNSVGVSVSVIGRKITFLAKCAEYVLFSSQRRLRNDSGGTTRHCEGNLLLDLFLA